MCKPSVALRQEVTAFRENFPSHCDGIITFLAKACVVTSTTTEWLVQYLFNNPGGVCRKCSKIEMLQIKETFENISENCHTAAVLIEAMWARSSFNSLMIIVLGINVS